MKIGLVLSRPPSYSETFFTSKIKGLQKQGYEVILFVQHTNKFDQCRVVQSFPVKMKYGSALPKMITAFVRILKNYKQVLKFLKLEKERKNSSEIQLLKGVYFNAHLFGRSLDWLHFGYATMALGKENIAKSIGAKMAVSFRGFDMAIYPIKNPNCYKLLWKRVTKVHSISDSLYTQAINQGLDKNTAYEKITPAINTSCFSKKLDVKNNDIVKIITVGRLHWVKGISDTLLAIKQLKEAEINIQYTIVGEGQEYEKLMYIRNVLGLEAQVTFIGKVSHTAVKELLSYHEIYLQYSMSEGFCNAVLEAQAMGLLCVVSDAGGLPENVQDKKTGWVVPKRNPKQLVIKLLEVIKLPESEKKRIITAAQSRVEKEFSLEKQQLQFLNFYTNQ